MDEQRGTEAFTRHTDHYDVTTGSNIVMLAPVTIKALMDYSLFHDMTPRILTFIHSGSEIKLIRSNANNKHLSSTHISNSSLQNSVGAFG